MNLEAWALRWNIPAEAIADLNAELGAAAHPAPGNTFQTEAGVQSGIRLAASKKGFHLWRNNVGACTDDNGNHIRYGLANDSSKINKVLKSSDLIGVRPVRIGRQHLGQLFGRFVAYEIKRPGWKYTGTEREKAQQNFITLINSMGGEAKFLTDPSGF